MFGKRKKPYAIGVDITHDGLQLAQLEDCGKDVSLLAGSMASRPDHVECGTARWQHWVIDTLRHLMSSEHFRGKFVNAAMPAGEVFIETIKMPKSNGAKLDEAIFTRIKPHLPSGSARESLFIKHIPTDQDNALVIATNRELINRYLAIYEKAGLSIKAIGIWPEALINCYTRFFGRRESDRRAVVMLLNVEAMCTNVVICRHKDVLFARSIPIGANALDNEKNINCLVMEVTACRRDFATAYRNVALSRLIFLSGPAVDTDIYATIAKQMEVQAQIGDCLVAAEMSDPVCQKLDRRDAHVSWATAFGLSML